MKLRRKVVRRMAGNRQTSTDSFPIRLEKRMELLSQHNIGEENFGFYPDCIVSVEWKW